MTANIVNEKQQIVNRWILEYTFSLVWKDFVECGSVDRKNNRDLIQWILGQQVFEEPEELWQIYILSLLCRLVDGETYETKYEAGSNLTVLEDAAGILETFLKDIPQSLQKEGHDFLDTLKQQAVYVCCRDDNFEAAKEVYARQFSEISSERSQQENKENNNREIQKLLKSENPKHSTLNTHRYTDFLHKAQKFLKHFIKTDEPVLLQMAHKKWKPQAKGMTNGHDKFKDKFVNLESLTKVCETMGEPKERSWPNFMEQRDLKEHIQRVNTEKTDQVNSNDNANTASTNGSSPLKRKSGEISDSQGNSSLATRIRTNTNMNPRVILNAKLPKLHVPSPARSVPKATSSPGKLRKPWLEAEVNDFYQGVQIFGVGNWSQIRDAMKTSRTNVQLKDKWRTILKTGEIKRLEKEFGDLKSRKGKK
ncbi:telomeric repeat-binding factor 2-like [Saccostrea echinata]|uniref:telomeric repeat-binding factor 2-like n=1 Tax=Saccostrea echinata TaxID=191078 RepID=UPI002A7F4CBA|nr:telomeric repeat-binding factor 2-like [Saccostrea echinata]